MTRRAKPPREDQKSKGKKRPRGWRRRSKKPVWELAREAMEGGGE